MVGAALGDAEGGMLEGGISIGNSIDKLLENLNRLNQNPINSGNSILHIFYMPILLLQKISNIVVQYFYILHTPCYLLMSVPYHIFT